MSSLDKTKMTVIFTPLLATRDLLGNLEEGTLKKLESAMDVPSPPFRKVFHGFPDMLLVERANLGMLVLSKRSCSVDPLSSETCPHIICGYQIFGRSFAQRHLYANCATQIL